MRWYGDQEGFSDNRSILLAAHCFPPKAFLGTVDVVARAEAALAVIAFQKLQINKSG